MSNLDFEMIRVFVRPVDKCRDESGKRGENERGGKGDDGNFDVTDGGTDDFAIGGREEDDKRR